MDPLVIYEPVQVDGWTDTGQGSSRGPRRPQNEDKCGVVSHPTR